MYCRFIGVGRIAEVAFIFTHIRGSAVILFVG